VSRQTTTTWKSSTDPHFIAKMRRVLELYDHRPADGRVICVDEFGPLNLMPRKKPDCPEPQGTAACRCATRAEFARRPAMESADANLLSDAGVHTRTYPCYKPN
jgi:hypothetical protein